MGEEEMGGNKRRREGTVRYFLMAAPRMYMQCSDFKHSSSS
jgi:hypothetical protein